MFKPTSIDFLIDGLSLLLLNNNFLLFFRLYIVKNLVISLSWFLDLSSLIFSFEDSFFKYFILYSFLLSSKLFFFFNNIYFLSSLVIVLSLLLIYFSGKIWLNFDIILFLIFFLNIIDLYIDWLLQLILGNLL